MSLALTNQLRESLLLERARKIDRIAPGPERVEFIRDILRITRDEGIKAGIKQAETHGHLLEKAS